MKSRLVDIAAPRPIRKRGPYGDRTRRRRPARQGVAWRLAVGGRVMQGTLQSSANRLARQQPPPEEADAMLEPWLRKKYDEVGLGLRARAA